MTTELSDKITISIECQLGNGPWYTINTRDIMIFQLPEVKVDYITKLQRWMVQDYFTYHKFRITLRSGALHKVL